jgi:hypothetical protein
MKFKSILAATLLATSLTASATNWVMVTESQEARLLVNSDSFTTVKGDDGTLLIAAQFSYVKDGTMSPAIAYVTELNACRTRNGVLYGRAFENGAWVTKNTYFWSVNGNKLYDGAGNALCDILSVRVRESSPKESSPTVNKNNI